MSNPSRMRPGNRGIALLLVIVILVMLAIVAVPFAMSMRMAYHASVTYQHEVEARFAARGAMAHAIHELYRTHDALEQTGALPAPFNTPGFDGQIELDVDVRSLVPKGSKTLLAARVEDEQGKVNLNSATPYLLGNLLASGVVTATIDAGATEITVDPESAGLFVPKNGLLWAGGELIRYATYEAGTFSGCQRGLFEESPEFGKARKLFEGQLVIDARAYLLSKLAYEHKPGAWYHYRTLEEMRGIAEEKYDETNRGGLLSATLAPQEFERLRPLLTVHSWRPSGEGWTHSQPILSGFPTARPDDQADVVYVAFPFFYTTGSIVRITNGATTDYAMVLGSGLAAANTNKGRVVLNKKIANTYERFKATLSVQEPHAINLNTAHPKILYALFKGIGLGAPQLGYGRVVVAPAEAAAITGAIMKLREERGILRHEKDLRDLLVEINKQDAAKLDARKIDVIVANCCYGGMGLGIRTAPVTFKTGNTFTLEATGIVHGEQGKELARHSIRQIVEVSVPMSGTHWSLGGQAAFQRALYQYPGWHFVTWPAFVPLFDRTFNHLTQPETEGDPPVPLGNLRLRASEVEWAQEHFPNTHDGVEIEKATPVTDVSGQKLQKLLGAQAKLMPQTGNISTASISFWMKIKDSEGLAQYILDIGEKEFENRIALYYDSVNKELVFEVKDCTLEQKKAQVRAAITPEKDVWYHVGICWKSTLDGQLALFLDGRPVGSFTYYDIAGNKIGTHLTSDLSDTATEIAVKDTAGFPPQGAVRIGAEVIEYEKLTKTGFQVRQKYDSGFQQPVALARGARGTQAMKHSQDHRVVPWGYVTPLLINLFPGHAKLKGELPKGRYTVVRVPPKQPSGPNPGPPQPGVFLKTDKECPVADTSGFPDKGYIAVGRFTGTTFAFEYIYYSGKDATKFTGLTRGAEGSNPMDFPNGSLVLPISIWVDQHTEYVSGDKVRQLLQIANEWCRYTKKVTNDNESFFLLLDGLEKMFLDIFQGADWSSPLRGIYGTTAVDHSAGAKVIPVFEFPNRIGPLPIRVAGRFDRVTLINKNNNAEREERMVNWAWSDPWQNPDTPNDDRYFVAFEDFLTRPYVTSGPPNSSRMLRFPSGELPNQIFPVYAGGKNPNAEIKGGTVRFKVDEVAVEGYGLPGPFFLGKAASPSDDTLTVTGITFFPKEGSLVKLADEIVAYTETEVVDPQNQIGLLKGVKRGFLGTTPVPHDVFTPVFNLAYCRMGVLQGQVPPTGSELTVTNGQRFPMEGYVLAGQEILTYSWRQMAGTRAQLMMPLNGKGEGAFRGRYGTERATLADKEIVYVVPWRYHDRYCLETDHPDAAVFQSAWSARSTRFLGLAWEDEHHGSAHLAVHALVRIDGTPGWDAKPVKDPDEAKPGQLMLFTNGKKANKIILTGDRVEVRFLYHYKPGVLNTRYWKETAHLKSFKLDYASGPTVLHRESAR